MIILLSWRPDQWAYAHRRYRDVEQLEKSATLSGAVELRAWWQTHSYPEPLSMRFEGVEPSLDMPWAWELFMSVPNHVGVR